MRVQALPVTTFVGGIRPIAVSTALNRAPGLCRSI